LNTTPFGLFAISSDKTVAPNPPFVGPVFVVLAIVFLSLAARAYLKREGDPSVARKAWFRIGIIFGIVGLYLYGFPHLHW